MIERVGEKMNKGKWKRMMMLTVGMVLVALVAWQLSKSITFREPLTKDEARTMVQDLYKGEIVEVQEQQNVYIIVIKLETGTYEVKIDRKTGEIGTLAQIQSNVEKTPEEQSQQETPATQAPETPADDTKEEPTQPITEEEAVAIALQSIKGIVDEVETEQVGGVTYYLIEIEREDGQEGIVQIHGITGAVISITWDD